MATTPAPPRSPRGERTRAALVAGARTVFERDGFVEARIVDIAREAGVATGSFYTYFASKEEAFLAVLAELREEMLHPRHPHHDAHTPVVQRVATGRAVI